MMSLRAMMKAPRQIIAAADRTMVGMMIAGVAVQLGLVVSGIVAARVLGPSDRGYLAGYQSIAVAGSFIVALGVPIAVAFFVAHDNGHTRGIIHELRWIIVAQLVVALLIPAAIFAFVLVNEPAYARTAAWISLPLMAILLVGAYSLRLLQGMHRFLAFNLLLTIPIPCYGLALVVLSVIGHGSLVAFTLAYTVIFGIAEAVGVYVVYRWLPERGEGSVPLREMLSYGLKGQIGSASPLETFQIDFLIVGAMLGPYWLGLYAGAMAFTNLPRFVAQSVGVVAFPRVASSIHSDHAVRSALDAVGLASAFALVVVIGLELIVGWLIPFLFGPSFAASVPIARVLLLAALFLSVRRIVGDVMRGGGAPLPSTSAELISWVVYAALIVPLVHRHGALGAAWAMTAAAAVSTTWLVYLALQMLRRFQAAET